MWQTIEKPNFVAIHLIGFELQLAAVNAQFVRLHATHAATSSNLFFSLFTNKLHSSLVFHLQIGCNELNGAALQCQRRSQTCTQRSCWKCTGDAVRERERVREKIKRKQNQKELALSYLEQRANCKSLQWRHALALPLWCVSFVFNFHSLDTATSATSQYTRTSGSIHMLVWFGCGVSSSLPSMQTRSPLHFIAISAVACLPAFCGVYVYNVLFAHSLASSPSWHPDHPQFNCITLCAGDIYHCFNFISFAWKSFSHANAFNIGVKYDTRWK